MTNNFSKTEDFVEKRIEGAIQTFNNLFLDHKKEIKGVIEEQIKVTVNGKIDKLQKDLLETHKKQSEQIEKVVDTLKNQDIVLLEMKEFLEVKKGITSLGKMVIWLSAVVGAVLGVFKIFKI